MKIRLSRFLLTMFCCELAGLAWGQQVAERASTMVSLPSPDAIKLSLQAEPRPGAGLSGRLFFSREQRERLDRARIRGDVMEDADLSEATPSTINGFVKRSDGTTTVWVDGVAKGRVPEAALRSLQPSDIGGSGEKIRVVLRDDAPKPITKQRAKRGVRKPSTQKSAAKR